MAYRQRASTSPLLGQDAPEEQCATALSGSCLEGVCVVVRNTFLELQSLVAQESNAPETPVKIAWADESDTETAAPSDNGTSECIDVECGSRQLDSRTSLVLKNLPFVCPNTMIVGLLDSAGLRGEYDFVYAPTNFKIWESYGYGFVNMVSNEAALRAMESLQGHAAWATAERQPLEVCFCESTQGLESHVERYRNSPVMHAAVEDQYKPLFFKDGSRQPFPAPTMRIKAPKCRHGHHFDRERKQDL